MGRARQRGAGSMTIPDDGIGPRDRGDYYRGCIEGMTKVRVQDVTKELSANTGKMLEKLPSQIVETEAGPTRQFAPVAPGGIVTEEQHIWLFFQKQFLLF